MIRLHRPACPAVLEQRGAVLTARDVERHAADPEAFRAGRKRIAFKAPVYSHPAVKEVLRAFQHGKCAFCESKLGHITSGDVEHLRPKAGVRQEVLGSLERPGYFWLAYDWDNLFLACELCNRRFKRNFFPLRDPSRRARRPNDRVEDEEPLLIDPARENPAGHVSFSGWSVAARSAKGTATIQTLGLDRPLLDEERRRLFRSLSALRDLLDAEGADRNHVAEARSLLVDACQPSSPWSAMANALIRLRPLPTPT